MRKPGHSLVYPGNQERRRTVQDYEDSRLKIEEGVKDLRVPKPGIYKTSDLAVTYAQGTVPIRVYQPSPSPDLPVVYHVHGGAWVGGSIDTHDNVCRSVSNLVPCVVVSVEYRRPPEYKFPIAVDDCYAVLKWLLQNHSQVICDIRQLALMGDSAGGNLVAALCARLRDEGLGDTVSIQVLVNPALDLRRDSKTYQTYKKYVDWYLTDSESESKLVYASPLAASGFQGLPKAFVVTCENDELGTEGEEYCRLLRRDGVDASLYELKGMGHLGVFWAAAHPQVDEAGVQIGEELRRSFSQSQQGKIRAQN